MRISDWSSDVCSSDLNGSKIWTSYADKADWIFCLVRTDKTNKYQGITFMLFDMESPGVSTKPILLISGNSPFCDTFFDDVKVPKDQFVGEVNRGWDVAKRSEEHTSELQQLMRTPSADFCL